MQLRPYQHRAIDELRACFQRGHRAPCLVLPTGSGKTVIASEVIRSARERGRRVLFAAHRSELIAQSVAKLERAGVTNVRVIQAGTDTGDDASAVMVASIPTLAAKNWRDRLPPADLVILDECHHTPAKTWARVAKHYASSLLIGLTATSQRADGKPLGDIFDSIVVGSTVAELTELGHLVPCRVWAPSSLPGPGEIAMSAADAYRRHGHGRRAIIFCVTVEHAEQIAKEMPVPAAVIHGKLAATDRAERLARFRAGELLALCSVHVLTEGFDEPSAAICIMTRKPAHAGTFLQCVGRVLRPAPDKAEAVLVDLGGAVWKHGTPDAERRFTLDGDGIETVERLAIRQCPTCGAVFTARIDRRCPQCHVELPAMGVDAPRPRATEVREVKERIAPADMLMTNLLDAARRSRRSITWAKRAHAEILARWAR